MSVRGVVIVSFGPCERTGPSTASDDHVEREDSLDETLEVGVAIEKWM